MQVSADVTAE